MLLHQLLQGKRLVLASNSPRRKQLLAGLDVPFEVWLNSGNEPECYPDTLAIADVAPYLARQKAANMQQQMADDVVLITSDTVVCCNGQVLGKPSSPEAARQMLAQLAGTTHTVVTGVCITTKEQQHVFSTATDVTFAPN